MRKIFLTVFIFFAFGLCVFADTPKPVMRPASPDVPSEVKSDDGDYLPNVIKQHKEQQETQSVEDVIDDDDDEEYEEEEEEVTPQQEQKQETKQETQQEIKQENTAEPQVNDDDNSLEDVLEGDKNPINNDSTEENIKNKNFVPEPQTVEEKKAQKATKSKKTKKGKKEKPKYGKYQDVDNDLYIQDWENELKNPTTGTDETGEEETTSPKKTYTQDDYEQAYRDMQVPTFSFVHGVDPDQYYDMKDTMWSPYPLLRLNSPLYFKTITIEPGYYLLTPREYKGDWYILFKEAGAVKYTIPVMERSFVSATYYRDNLKELDMTKSARWQVKFLNAWGKYVRKSKRKPAVQCNVELTDLDNNFLLLDLYFGPHKYSTIFRIEKF